MAECIDYIEKAKILIEALPFIKQFYGKIFVIKYGGHIMTDPVLKATLMEDITLFKMVGIKPVIVHGGGPEIDEMLQKMGKETRFVNGLRVTDEETMDLVEMVLSGKINKRIVNDIENQGLVGVGIGGKDGDTLIAKKMEIEGDDLGLVGEVDHVNPELIMGLIKNDVIPVIAPIGKDRNGNTYNINADYAASAIAGAINAEKLIFLTDVPGVLRDPSDKTSVINFITEEEVEELKASGMITGGMIPKVDCCLAGLHAGVHMVHILDGRVEHCILLEIFTKNGIGTMFTKEKIIP
jgi:acetylglutamate kinase